MPPSQQKSPGNSRATRSKFSSYEGTNEQETQALQAALMWELSIPTSRHITTTTTTQQRRRFTTELKNEISWSKARTIAETVLTSRSFKIHQGRALYAQEFYKTHMTDTHFEPKPTSDSPFNDKHPSDSTNRGITKAPAPAPAPKQVNPGKPRPAKDPLIYTQDDPTTNTTTPTETNTDEQAPPPTDTMDETLDQLELRLASRLADEQRKFMTESDASATLTKWLDMTVQEHLDQLQHPVHVAIQDAESLTNNLTSQTEETTIAIQQLNTLVQDMEQRTMHLQQRLEAATADLNTANTEMARLNEALDAVTQNTDFLKKGLTIIRSQSGDWQHTIQQHIAALRATETSTARSTLQEALHQVTTELEQEYRRICSHKTTQFEAAYQQVCNRTLQKLEGTINGVAYGWHDELNQQYDDLELKAQDLIETAIMTFQGNLAEAQTLQVEEYKSILNATLHKPATTEPLLQSLKDKLREEFKTEATTLFHDHEHTLRQTHRQLLQELQQHKDRISQQPSRLIPDLQQAASESSPDITKEAFMADNNATWDATTDEDLTDHPASRTPSPYHHDGNPSYRHPMAKAHAKETKTRLANFRRDDLYLLLPSTITEEHMISAYNAIVTSMRTFDLPIRDFANLTPTCATTCPPEQEHGLTPDTIDTIGRDLYNKLAQSINKECRILREVIVLHGTNQDGYRALFHMLALKCNSLKHIPDQWGPKWESNQSPHEYATRLQTYTAYEAKKGRKYTDVELASEMIQQAMTHQRYEMMGHTLLAQIMGLENPNGTLPPRFSLPNLAATFQQYQARQPTPVINKFQSTPDARKPRRSNNHVQCTSCHRYGHNVGDQICHFSAQLVHATKWTAANATKAQNNATAFATANQPRTVNKMEQHFPERFHPDMSITDRETARYDLATIFLPSDDDDTTLSDPEHISSSASHHT